ncbi:MAG: ABC transporter ATP-binding protein [Candidatus Woesearchaeota archaeon]
MSAKKYEKNIVIKMENVSKSFSIFIERDKTLKDYLISKFSRRFNDYIKIEALKDINLTIRKGECVGIIGRNSAGKSTLLKIVANVLKSDSGVIYTDGIILPLLELGVGFNPELTGIENIFLNGALLGIPKEKIKAQLKNIIEFSELGEFIDLKLKHYSSGMIARLAFSIATIHEPDIILIDEVLAVGDSIFQEKCINKIMEFKKENKTIIFVSHDPNSIKMICNRLIVMNDGLIVFDGNVEEGLVFYNGLLNEIKLKKQDLSRNFFNKREEEFEKENVGKENINKLKKTQGKKLLKNAKNFEKAKELIEQLLKAQADERLVLKELTLMTKDLNDSEIKTFYNELNSFVQGFDKEERLKILEILSRLLNRIK